MSYPNLTIKGIPVKAAISTFEILTMAGHYRISFYENVPTNTRFIEIAIRHHLGWKAIKWTPYDGEATESAAIQLLKNELEK